jgi:oxygen-dependent protoporphyrinogen oxidase
MPRVVIVGAGISGLSLAYRLHQAAPGIEITVLEAGSRVGGKVWTEHRDGFTVECGPNGFLDANPSTIDLTRDLGLADRLLPASEASARHRYLFLDGRLQPLPAGPLALLRSPLLSLRGKLELLGEPFRRRRRGRGPESVAAFARRRAGREAAAVFADALVTGIHGGDPALLDVRAAFPRLTAFEVSHGSVIRGMIRASKERRAAAAARGEQPARGQMWSFREGLRTLVEALRDRLPAPPLLGVGVRRVEPRPGGGWAVVGDGGDRWEADAVVLACPADAQAAMLADLDPGLAELAGGIAYNRIAVVALGYRAADVPPVDGFGFIAPQRTRRDLLGVQWCSAIYPGRAPAGMVLWRALCGGWHRAEVVDWPDKRLVGAVRAELQLAQGVSATPAFVRVVRWDRAIPQYRLGHPERVAAIKARAARHPGLVLAGNAYHGVALNDCTEQSGVLAREITRFAARRA